jgi:cytoskeletal protein RodZ
MQTIGERLEEARKRKGVSIREAAEATKIRSDYLQKFEANSFDLDLPPLYIRGFMRSYARYLDLDQERFIAEYDSVAAAEGRGPRRTESRENYGRVEFAEGGEAAAGKRGGVDQAMLMKYGLFGGGAIAVIVVLILIINFFTSSPSPAPKPAQAAQTAPAAAEVQPATPSEATLTVTVAEPTRVKISYMDGSSVFLDGKFPMNRGDVKTITFTKDLLITLEHPNRIRLERNGRSLDLTAVKPMSRFKVPLADPN